MSLDLDGPVTWTYATHLPGIKDTSEPIYVVVLYTQR